MAEATERPLRELAAKRGMYPATAYAFVRDGLTYAVHRVHGPETPSQLVVLRFLIKHKIDLEHLRELYVTSKLPESVVRAIDENGFESLNRHVTGAQLCWGLREYAHRRWGRLARMVLETWNVRSTLDIGRMVFHMIEHQLMQRQPEDSLDDFKDVFDMTASLEGDYTIDLNGDSDEE